MSAHGPLLENTWIFHFVFCFLVVVDKMDVFSSRVREITDKFIEIPEEFHNLLVNLSTADGERFL